jgi:hypothetical protein
MVPALSDLVTILYRPSATMRRILDNARDRWTIQIVILALVCATVNDTDVRRLADVLPGLTLTSIITLALAMIIGIGLMWVAFLFLAALLVKYTGRAFGGTGTARDIRAALAWAMVPVVWSLIYRIPVALYQSRLPLGPNTSPREMILGSMDAGGCSVAVVFLALQLIFFVWCVVIAAATVAEAHHVPIEKGAAILAVSLIIPPAVILAAALAVTMNS